ncbi:hypothetical protein JCM17204_07150 [Blautia stercoris]
MDDKKYILQTCKHCGNKGLLKIVADYKQHFKEMDGIDVIFTADTYLLSILIDDNTYVLLKPSSIFKIEGVDIQPKMSWIAKKDGGMALIYDDEE